MEKKMHPIKPGKNKPGKKKTLARAPHKRAQQATPKEQATEPDAEEAPGVDLDLNQDEQHKVVNHLEENAQGSAKNRDEAN